MPEADPAIVRRRRPVEPQAVRIARWLVQHRGATAFAVAERRRCRAVDRRQTAQADLYRGVCTILDARHQAYAGLLRRQEPGPSGERPAGPPL